MTTERIEIQRPIAADPAAVVAVVSDPQGHVARTVAPGQPRPGA